MDKREQLEALMGERCWFGDGSKIIVVTKNKHLLTEVEVDGMYHAMELDRDQSLQLFSLHAFRETRLAKDYEELSEKVVDYCEGLPLALKILGSHLSTRDKAGWKIDIAHWRNIMHDDIQAKLRVSFDALDVDASEIFLDIACFFVGKDKDYVADIVGARYSCHPEVAFRALIGRSLITINNSLWMHDIVRNMGREIICQRSHNHPGNCSRIVLQKDAYRVLSKEMGTKAVEGLTLDVQGSFSTKSFTKMRRLQLLQIIGAYLAGSYRLQQLKDSSRKHGQLKSLQTLNVVDCSQLEKLPENLGDLESLTKLFAKGTAIKPLPTSARYLKKLTNCSSSIAMLPASLTSFSSLKELDLSYAGLSDAISSIELGSLSFLEDLDLSGNGFFNLPSSISRLPKLQCFTVERCKNLLSISELPSSVLFLSINDCASIERVSAPLQHEEPPCLSGLCKGKCYDIYLIGGEIPEWFSHRGEGSALSFHLPSVSVPDVNKLQALLFWVVLASTNEATPKTSLSFYEIPLSILGYIVVKEPSHLKA
uniref:Disease resistance protein Roq1-like winged-helix domain-containing protein n=1 Tax=Salix viminalis TaxID=40686 RepID=A0A6N2KHY8_SALVM